MTKAEQVKVVRKKIEFEKGFLEDQMMQGKHLEIAQLKKHKKNNQNLICVITV